MAADQQDIANGENRQADQQRPVLPPPSPQGQEPAHQPHGQDGIHQAEAAPVDGVPAQRRHHAHRAPRLPLNHAGQAEQVGQVGQKIAQVELPRLNTGELRQIVVPKLQGIPDVTPKLSSLIREKTKTHGEKKPRPHPPAG